ncbi:MAG: hypothetical protein JWP89_5056 [Schlesneria sp.]|nr:hypothetical protein [Schlesneria sp.]
MRPMECSDLDIRQATEIVVRITLHTTAYVKDVSRPTSTIGRRLEVDVLTDQEQIEFEKRVQAILAPAKQHARIRERAAA